MKMKKVQVPNLNFNNISNNKTSYFSPNKNKVFNKYKYTELDSNITFKNKKIYVDLIRDSSQSLQNNIAITERGKTSSSRYTEPRFYRKNNLYLKQISKLKKPILYNKNIIDDDSHHFRINHINFMPSRNIMDQKLFSQYLKNDNSNKNTEQTLPIYLRYLYKIRGTNITSPFCIKARNESLYRSIYYKYLNSTFYEKRKVNNILNIKYAENEEIFKKKMRQINTILQKKGKKGKNSEFPNSEGKKLEKLNNQIQLMRRIFDYAFPEMVLSKVREERKKLENKGRNKIIKLPPYKSVDLDIEKNNKILTKNLLQSISIFK